MKSWHRTVPRNHHSSLVCYPQKSSHAYNIAIFVTSHKSLGIPLNLPAIRHFPEKNKFFDIAEEIGTDYERFGTFLLEDNNGNKIKIIERNKRGDVVDINVEILRQWLQGKGRRPVTWQTLINCVRDSKLTVLLERIESSLSKKDKGLNSNQREDL